MNERLAIDGGTPVRTRPFGPHHDFGEQDIAALAEVVRSGNLSKGPRVAQFEQAFADRHGVRHAISVTSGTAAMHVCIGAINPDPGAEIIVSPWTSGGSIIGALLHNCVPIFADIDDTYTLDPKDVEAKITPRTRAIIAVHLFGNPCNMEALHDIARRHQIFLIEDCCQAHFAEYQGQLVGTHGDIAGYSFGGKHLSAGMGGIVLTNNEVLWERGVLFSDAALPRANGPYEGRPYANYFLASNYRINDLIAAVLLVQLNKVQDYIANKIRAAQQITAGLQDLEELTPQQVRPGDRHTYWVYGLTIDTSRLTCSAWEFAEAVTQEGVPIGGPYIGSSKEGPLYRNPFLADAMVELNLIDTQGGGIKRMFETQRRRSFPLPDYDLSDPGEVRVGLAGRVLDERYTRLLMERTDLDLMEVILQMRPSFTEEDVADIVHAIRKVTAHYRQRTWATA